LKSPSPCARYRSSSGALPQPIYSPKSYHDIYKKGYLDEELAEVKVLTLYWGPVGDVNTVNPVNTVAELEGLKVANAQGATCIELMDRLGAVSVLAGPPDIYLMLQKGIADAMFGAVPMILEFHLDEFIQYLLPIQTTHMSHVVGLNLDVYNSMPDDVKKIIDEMPTMTNTASVRHGRGRRGMVMVWTTLLRMVAPTVSGATRKWPSCTRLPAPSGKKRW
jgi:hypothetical protein